MQYKVTLTPNKPKLTVKVSADSAEKFTATVTDLNLTNAEVHPEGSPIDKAIETAAEPLVQVLVDDLVKALVNRVKGQHVSATLEHPLGYRIEVQGVTIPLTAKNLTLGTHETHLLASGGIEVQA